MGCDLVQSCLGGLCVFITAEPITNLFARGGMEEQQLLPPRTAWLCVFTTAGPVCVFITAGPITKCVFIKLAVFICVCLFTSGRDLQSHVMSHAGPLGRRIMALARWTNMVFEKEADGREPAAQPPR